MPLAFTMIARTAVLLVGVSSVAVASPRTLHVHSEGETCPTPQLVVDEAQRLFTRTRIEVGEAAEDGLELYDLGDTYRIAGAGVERTFADAERRCDERARAIAVVLALSFEPPSFTPAAASPPPPPRRRRRMYADLELGGSVAGTFERGSAVSGGGFMRVSFGFAHVRLTLGATALSPAQLDFAGTKARLTRIPIDIGLRGALRIRRVELNGDLGFAATITVGNGVDLPMPSGGTRLDPGIRMAAGSRVWLGERVAPFVAVEGIVSIHPIDLTRTNVGKVGSTPYGWLGAVLGLAVRLH
jgi:hypothetical protein